MFTSSIVHFFFCFGIEAIEHSRLEASFFTVSVTVGFETSPLHRIGLAGACLAVSENRAVIAWLMKDYLPNMSSLEEDLCE